MTAEKRTRYVRFGSLEIVELPYTIGDNPCVSSGPPIAASWLSQKKTKFDIDFFERHRPARRSRKELVLSTVDRNALLVQSGHSASEITNATSQASITRNERFETIDQLRLLCRALAEQATQKRLALKKKQRKPPPPTPTPPKSRKSHQCIAIEFPNFPGLVLTPLKRQKRAGLIKHPGLGPEMHGNGSMMMVPPKRVLSPPPSTYNRKTLVSS